MPVSVKSCDAAKQWELDLPMGRILDPGSSGSPKLFTGFLFGLWP
jgi:hypothetical protein